MEKSGEGITIKFENMKRIEIKRNIKLREREGGMNEQ